MRLTLWPGAMPITFKTVAGERECRIKEDVYAYLIQSKNGNLFTLDHENNLRTVNSRNSYLDSLDDSELLKYLRNAFGISQREMAKCPVYANAKSRTGKPNSDASRPHDVKK